MICEVKLDTDELREFLLSRARASIVAAAEYCLERAIEYCPVDTGQLRQSGGLMPDSNPDVVWVTFTAPYAAFVEFGHYTRNQASWVPPQPFLRYGVADATIQFPSIVSQVWANPVAKGDGSHYYASRFAYSREEFVNQYTSLGFPEPGPSE